MLHTSWPREFLSERNVLCRSRIGERATKSQVINSSFLTLNQEPTPASPPARRPGQYFQSLEAKSWSPQATGRRKLEHSLDFVLLYAVSFFCSCNPTWLARDSKLQPIKITQFFATGTGYGKVKKQGNFWLPRKIRKECATEFMTLVDYVIPRNKKASTMVVCLMS